MYAEKPEIRVSGDPLPGVSEAQFDEFLMSGLYGDGKPACKSGMDVGAHSFQMWKMHLTPKDCCATCATGKSTSPLLNLCHAFLVSTYQDAEA